jgi:hypothetical protein
MASPSSNPNSSVPSFTPPTINQNASLKLDNNNYLMWLTQVLPILRHHELLGIVDGSEPCPPKFITNDEQKEVLNPEFTVWNKKDQYLLSVITSSLTESVLASVYGLHTSKQAWTALATRFASQSKSRISHLKKQLQTLAQGPKTCSEFLLTAKSLADQLAAAGNPISDEELISYITNGLNSPFTSFITTYSFATRDTQISFDDFQDELLSHEMLLNQQQSKVTDSSAIALTAQRPTNPQVSKGKGPMYPPSRYAPRNYSPRPNYGSQPRPQYHQYSRGPHHYNQGPQFSQQQYAQGHSQPTQAYSQGHMQPRPTFSPRPQSQGLLPTPSNLFNSSTRVPCQICGKSSHLAIDCYHRMDYAFQGRNPPAQLAAMVAHTNAAYEEPQWLADSGANAHITNSLENLNIQQPFQHNEEVAVGNGTGLAIENIGSSLLHTSNSSFKLQNILHCPQASANLLSIQKFCLDNCCYFILTSSHYFVKDLKTHALLLEGKSEHGLYPIRFGGKLHRTSKTFTALLGIRTTSLMWHFRLGHPSLDIVNRVVKDKHLPVSVFDFNNTSACNSCQLGKSKRQPFNNSTRISLQPLDLIHSDIWTSPITSISGCKYHVVFIDDFSRFTWIYPLYNKSEVFDSFVKFKLLVENQFSSKIKQLQSDGGGEYMSNHFQSFLTKHGIIHRKSCPYTSQQNGLAERKLRHILETGLTLLAHCHLSNRYWVDAFITAVHIINRLPTPTLQHLSPFFKLYNREPNYQELRVFGCLCYPLLRPYGLHKLEYRSKPCIFLGYHHASYKCLDPVTNKVYLSRHVVFNEASFPAKDQAVSLLPSKVSAQGDVPFILPVQFSPLHLPHTSVSHPTNPPSTSPGYSLSSPSSNPEPLSPDFPSPAAPDSSDNFPSSLQPSPSALPTPSLPDQPASSLDPSPSLPIPAPPTHSMVTRSRTGTLRPKPFPNYKLFHTLISETEPSSYSKAALDPKWQAAMQLEYDALISNGTWTLCPRPLHHNIIRNKWVYRIKRHADGTVERFKARLVAKGFDQRSGIDYTETFSPVIKPSTIRVILTLAVHFDWEIRQLDVSNAFLQGSLLEEVYMEQPQGFINNLHPTFVCRLHKALYGLKQAPRAWFTRLSTFLLDIGFTASLVDTSLFIFCSGQVQIFLLVYVDDIILTGTHSTAISALIARLQGEFPLKDLGPLHFFLGIQVTRSPFGLHLCQTKYITDLLSKTHMSGAKSAKSPCPSGSKLSRLSGSPFPILLFIDKSWALFSIAPSLDLTLLIL